MNVGGSIARVPIKLTTFTDTFLQQYQELRRISAEKTAQQQAAHVEKERARLLIEKEKDAIRATKAAKEKEVIEDGVRERARMEAERIAEEKRRALVLPKTRNLYGMQQELAKRGLQLASLSSKRTMATTSSVRFPMSKEEKAAKKRAALFRDDDSDGEVSGGMALAQASARKGSQLGKESPRSRTPVVAQTKSKKATSSRFGTNGISSGSKMKTEGSPSTMPTSSSARDRLIAAFDPRERLKLNTEKRDLRTVDEVEMDMRKKRLAGAASTGSPSKKSEETAKIPSAMQHGASNGNGSIKPIAARPSKLVSSLDAKRSRPAVSPSSQKRSRQRRSSSFSRSSEELYDPASRSSAVSREIQAIFGRGKTSRYIDSDEDSDGSGDMEASNGDIWREEEQAARIAAREESREQEKLRARAEQKRQRLQSSR